MNVSVNIELPKKAGFYFIKTRYDTIHPAWFEYRYSQFWVGGQVIVLDSIVAWLPIEMPKLSDFN